jgi:hypothetical protein
MNSANVFEKMPTYGRGYKIYGTVKLDENIK